MKRTWLGFALLILLMAGTALASRAMTVIHDPIEADLQQAAQCALLGDWEDAAFFSGRAKDRWEKWEHFRACLADHTPVEDIDADLATLEIYRDAREDIPFAAVCRALARRIAAVGEAHELVWWNLL